MCSLCARPAFHSKPFKRCGKCKTRTYCDKKCQIIDWKLGGHKNYCQSIDHPHSDVHEPWCAYLDRDPELDEQCLVVTGKVKENPRELITTGMNTCIFVGIKTATRLIGWHAPGSFSEARSLFTSVRKEEIVSGYIVPGEDRMEGSLDLKPTCRTMRAFPWNDPTESRRQIFDFLQDFEWFKDLEILSPIKSYKDFVVFDMAHKKPHVFSNTELFDQGCAFDGNVDAHPMAEHLSSLNL